MHRLGLPVTCNGLLTYAVLEKIYDEGHQAGLLVGYGNIGEDTEMDDPKT